MADKDSRHVKPVHALLFDRLSRHASLTSGDREACASLRSRAATFEAGQDVVRQGDTPDSAVFVVSGMLGRYHTLRTGERQYLSFHISSDMPDLQSLFLVVMDHSVAAMSKAVVAYLKHQDLLGLIHRAPNVGLALWHLSLVDAAIFRQAITNNSSRSAAERLAHFFCEQLFRAQRVGIAEDGTCSLPLSQTEIGQALGLSLVSVNRALQRLRSVGLVTFGSQRLTVSDFDALAVFAGFDRTYLHALD